MADTTASCKLIFQSPYKGGTKQWSTKLHVTGGNWQDQTHFNTFADALWTDIRPVVPTRTSLVEAVAYNPGSDLPVFTKSYGQAGTYDETGRAMQALEVVALLRFTTDARSTKNHPIYLFNYIHDVPADSTDTPETPRADWKASWQTRCNNMVAGYSDGTLTRKRAGPRGAVAQSGAIEDYFTHRDFPR